MKLLFVTNIPAPYRVDFFNVIGKIIKLTVLFERGSASDRDKTWKADTCHNFSVVMLKTKQFGADQSIGLAAVRHLKKNKYDIIVFTGYSSPTIMLALAYCRRNKIPYVISSDGAFLHEEGKLKYALKKHFIGSASFWLSTSKLTSDYFAHYGAKPERTYIFPFTSIWDHNVLPNLPTAAEKKVMREKLGIREKRIILSVGQFIPRKGFDILLRAYGKMRKECSTGLYIIGGAPTEEYMALVEKLHLQNVHFIGFMPKADVSKYYFAADLYVMPTREDIWGLVINEAMAFGLSVISSNACMAGITLIEDGVNGYIVPSENVDAFALTIQKLLYSEEDMKKMGQNNLIKIKEYTIEKMAGRHCELFEMIVEEIHADIQASK